MSESCGMLFENYRENSMQIERVLDLLNGRLKNLQICEIKEALDKIDVRLLNLRKVVNDLECTNYFLDELEDVLNNQHYSALSHYYKTAKVLQKKVAEAIDHQQYDVAKSKYKQLQIEKDSIVTILKSESKDKYILLSANVIGVY